jgi:hypothetical protein
MKIVELNNEEESVTIKMNDIRTITITPEEIVITDDNGDYNDPIIKKYGFGDMEMMNDVISEINAPLYAQLRKLIAKNKKLKAEMTELTEAKEFVKVAKAVEEMIQDIFITPIGSKEIQTE